MAHHSVSVVALQGKTPRLNIWHDTRAKINKFYYDYKYNYNTGGNSISRDVRDPYKSMFKMGVAPSEREVTSVLIITIFN